MLEQPFAHLDLQSAAGDLHIRITRKGKVLLTRAKPSRGPAQPSLAHNRPKGYPLPLDEPDEFLAKLGIMTAAGKVRASMQGKFRQINEFLRIIDQVIPPGAEPPGPVRLVDCGCGNAYLTFAAFHYLAHVRKLPVAADGVDLREDLIANGRALRDSLGWSGMEFHASSIADFTPAAPPDLVVSLHACDTATDEAIARGIQWGSRLDPGRPVLPARAAPRIASAGLRAPAAPRHPPRAAGRPADRRLPGRPAADHGLSDAGLRVHLAGAHDPRT